MWFFPIIWKPLTILSLLCSASIARSDNSKTLGWHIYKHPQLQTDTKKTTMLKCREIEKIFQIRVTFETNLSNVRMPEKWVSRIMSQHLAKISFLFAWSNWNSKLRLITVWPPFLGTTSQNNKRSEVWGCECLRLFWGLKRLWPSGHAEGAWAPVRRRK